MRYVDIVYILRGRTRWVLPLIFFMAMSVGCAATLPPDPGIATRGGGVFLSNVPFYPQDTKMCGPAALTSLLNYYNGASQARYDLAAVEEAIYIEKIGGTLLVDMLIYAREHGFYGEYYSGSIDDLKRKLRAGKPLILFLNLGIKRFPKGHYVVAVGYDDTRKLFFVHSDMKEATPIKYAMLEHAWKKTDYATLLVMAK